MDNNNHCFFAATAWDPDKRIPAKVERISGRTPFQMRFLEDLSKQESFHHFCGNPGYDGLDDFGNVRPYSGPVVVLWFDKSNQMHAVKLGACRVLRVIE